jgi:hypothetical protein
VTSYTECNTFESSVKQVCVRENDRGGGTGETNLGYVVVKMIELESRNSIVDERAYRGGKIREPHSDIF